MEIIPFPAVHQNYDFFSLLPVSLSSFDLGVKENTALLRVARILTVNTRRSVPGCSSHLAGQTGALDRLRPLLNAVLITASVSSNYFARAPL